MCESDLPNLAIIQYLVENKADPKAYRNSIHRDNAFHLLCDNKNCSKEIISYFISLDKEILKIVDNDNKTPFVNFLNN